MTGKIAVYLFAKVPALGRVKTRMQPTLSIAESLDLHCDLLRLCCDNLAALDSSRFQVELCVTEHSDALVKLACDYGYALQLQKGANLGARMSHAVRQGLRQHSAVVLVGADCPSVNAALLNEISHSLARNKVVMVPALDGGYVALGLTQYAPELFCNIPWGESTVAEETLRRVKQLEWPFECMPAEADIDRPDDLKYLRGRLDRWGDRFKG